MTESNPQLSMYYVTTGKWVGDKTLQRLIDRNKKELKDLNIFSDIRFVPCGAAEIQALYRNTKNLLSTKFKFEKYIMSALNDKNRGRIIEITAFMAHP